VLLSVISAAGLSEDREYAGLAAVIAFGAMLSKTVFTYDEVNGGLRRLTDAGEVLRKGDSFRPSTALLEFWRKSRARRAEVQADLKLLADRIGAPESSPGAASSPGISSEFISVATFDAAIASYLDARRRVSERRSAPAKP
jgi:hypothetical protein